MRCDQLQPSWKPSFLCCSECSRKIREYAPDLISCSRVRSEHVLGCSFLCRVTQNVQSKTAWVLVLCSVTRNVQTKTASVSEENRVRKCSRYSMAELGMLKSRLGLICCSEYWISSQHKVLLIV